MSTSHSRIGGETATCGVPWGICPEHGRSLRSSAGRTWCTAFGCTRSWDYDRLDTPCPEPVWAEVTFAEGETARWCEAHARDAHMYVRPFPPTIRRLDGVPFAGAPYDEGATHEPDPPGRPTAKAAKRPIAEPYAHAVVDALRAAGVVVSHYETTDEIPSIFLELDHGQSTDAGYGTRIFLEWGSTSGWRYGPEDLERSDAITGKVFKWAVPIGGKLLPTPAEMVELVERVVLHWQDEPEPQYRTFGADDDLAEQLERATHDPD